MEIELNSKIIPYGFAVCFNGNCKLRETCLRYQSGLKMPENRLTGNTVYPAAWKNGECQFYRDLKPIKMAWGFSNIYKNIPHKQVSDARSEVRCYLGSGMSAYYRVHHGEKMINPRKQADILEILSKYGSTEGITFDHYVTDLDFY